jgi:hypothetical protein
MFQRKALAVLSIFAALSAACSSAQEPDPESAIQTSAFTRTPEPEPDPSASGWNGDVGCRVSVGECMNSCPTRSGIAKREARCPEAMDPDSAIFACYCRD